MNENRELVFLDLAVYINEQRKVSGHWYQNPTKRETILNFYSCAPLHHKKQAVEGTIRKL